jgi:hypothetical protein
MRFVTAAESRREPWQPFGGAAPPRAQPVGVRHAVPAGVSFAGRAEIAECGAAVRAWALFLDLEFLGACPADCHRCAQIVARQRFTDSGGSRDPAAAGRS